MWNRWLCSSVRRDFGLGVLSGPAPRRVVLSFAGRREYFPVGSTAASLRPNARARQHHPPGRSEVASDWVWRVIPAVDTRGRHRRGGNDGVVLSSPWDGIQTQGCGHGCTLPSLALDSGVPAGMTGMWIPRACGVMSVTVGVL